MSASPTSASGSRGPREALRRRLCLIACCDREQRKLFELKSARLYALGVLLSYVFLLVLLRGRDHADVLADLTYDALAALSCIVGTLSALGAARNFARVAEWRAFGALAAQRGHSPRDVALARLLASAYRSGLLVGAPALGIVFVAFSCGKSFAWALATSVALVLYVLGMSGALALLARLAAWLSPRHARASLLLLGLCPLVIALGFPGMPSVPSVFFWALARIAALGAHFT
ncbi:MAG TPA: hypothetical protein VGM29_18940 [Polyangiaceae bacterium]